MPGPQPRGDLVRFDEKWSLDPATGCHVWGAATTRGGYGVFSPYRGRQTTAHRIAYTLKVGSIPAGLEIDHLCRNTLCVNPEHLEPVTAHENTRRSLSPSSKNMTKTHCPQGHAYDYVDSDGFRRCFECKRASRARSRARHRDAINEFQRADRIASPDKYREYNRRRREKEQAARAVRPV